ncbi:hypothetical protein OHR68_20020 [Spirillospora sp. NBC_00431]
MLQAAHQQLPGGKIVLVWENLNIHHSKRGPSLRKLVRGPHGKPGEVFSGDSQEHGITSSVVQAFLGATITPGRPGQITDRTKGASPSMPGPPAFISIYVSIADSY